MDSPFSGKEPLEEPLVKASHGSRNLGAQQTSDGLTGLQASSTKTGSCTML